MTKTDQKRIVREFTTCIRDEVLAHIKADRIPKEWDGHELRSLVAHKCDQSAARTTIHKERRSRRAKDFWDLAVFAGL
jgi:hypothetical protein